MTPWILFSTMLLAGAAHAQMLGSGEVTRVGGANALSTPAARHLVRVGEGTWLLAVQRDAGAGPWALAGLALALVRRRRVS